MPGINPKLEDCDEDKLHDELARKSIKRAEDKLYKVKERHDKGKKVM
jgi:hypothetical protein